MLCSFFIGRYRNATKSFSTKSFCWASFPFRLWQKLVSASVASDILSSLAAFWRFAGFPLLRCSAHLFALPCLLVLLFALFSARTTVQVTRVLFARLGRSRTQVSLHAWTFRHHDGMRLYDRSCLWHFSIFCFLPAFERANTSCFVSDTLSSERFFMILLRSEIVLYPLRKIPASHEGF